MPAIRTFVAIKISPELEAAFEALARNMRKLPGEVRWVDPQSIHVTLKFLGEITPAQVQEVIAAVERAANGIPPFSLKAGSKGAFPSLQRPRVFWVGLAEPGGDHLMVLQRKIEEELHLAGFPKEERGFKPHLTVGRVKGMKNIETVSKTFLEYPFPEIELAADRVLVMKSDLTPRGAIYTVQKAFPLKE